METGEHLESTGCTPAAWKVLLNPVFASEQQQAPPVLGGLAGVRAYIPFPWRASPSASQLLAFSPGKEQTAGEELTHWKRL